MVSAIVISAAAATPFIDIVNEWILANATVMLLRDADLMVYAVEPVNTKKIE